MGTSVAKYKDTYISYKNEYKRALLTRQCRTPPSSLRLYKVRMAWAFFLLSMTEVTNKLTISTSRGGKKKAHAIRTTLTSTQKTIILIPSYAK